MATRHNAYSKRVVSGALISALAVGTAFGARGASLTGTRTVTFQAEGKPVTISLDDRGASFNFSAPARAAVAAEPGKTISTAIYPSFTAAPGPSLLSLELARWRGAVFEEGALAAVELKLEEAVGDLTAGRGGFLTALALKLKAFYEADDRPASRGAFADAQAFVGTAIALSRPDGKVPPELGLATEAANKAAQNKETFLKEDLSAQTPSGRYGWDENLKRVYLTSSWLGRSFDRTDEREFRTALALAWVVENDAELARPYRALTALAGALTGFPAGSASAADYNALLGGRDAVTVLKELGTVQKLQAEAKDKGNAFVFLPSLGQPEVELIRRLAARGEARGGTWAEAYAAAISESSAPPRDAPWLDYMAYAWAALLTPDKAPEAARITWDDGYRKRLAESFVTAFDQVRARAPAAPPAVPGEALTVDVTPDFRLEPLPEYYLRMARAYARLNDILSAALTPPVMEGARGRRERGAAAAGSLAAEAADISQMFFGLYLLSCADIGMTPAVRGGEVGSRADAAERAYGWLEKWRSDPDMAQDVREAWPLGPADPSAPAKGTVYRCILGVRAVDVEMKYDRKPSFFVAGTTRKVNLHFKPAKYTVYVPVVVEVTVPSREPLTKAQFRALCNEHKTEGAIVAALKEYGKVEEPPAEEPPPPAEKEVDTGMVVLIVVLALFALIAIIALAASRQRF